MKVCDGCTFYVRSSEICGVSKIPRDNGTREYCYRECVVIPPRNSKITRDKVKRLYEDGVKIKDIQKALGLKNQSNVSYYVKNLVEKGLVQPRNKKGEQKKPAGLKKPAEKPEPVKEPAGDWLLTIMGLMEKVDNAVIYKSGLKITVERNEK